MIYIGNKSVELLRKHIQKIPCKTCGCEQEHLLIIYCKAFHFGILYPLKWWSSDKKGILICNNCKRDTTLDAASLEELPHKIQQYYNETKVPKHHRFPTFIFFGSLLILGLVMMFTVFNALFTIMKPVQSKLTGEWREEYARYKMFIYPDQTISLIGKDTIIYTHYTVDRQNIIINFSDYENSINKFQIEPLNVFDSEKIDFQFHKVGDNFTEDLYYPKRNQWRIKPKQPQNNQQIKAKILQYLNFEVSKYENAVKNELNISENDPNSPLEFAQNGIATTYESQDRWRYIFNNDEDWYKANDIIDNEFPTDFKPSEYNENLFQRNIDFLKKMISNIKNSKLEYL